MAQRSHPEDADPHTLEIVVDLEAAVAVPLHGKIVPPACQLSRVLRVEVSAKTRMDHLEDADEVAAWIPLVVEPEPFGQGQVVTVQLDREEVVNQPPGLADQTETLQRILDVPEASSQARNFEWTDAVALQAVPDLDGFELRQQTVEIPPEVGGRESRVELHVHLEVLDCPFVPQSPMAVEPQAPVLDVDESTYRSAGLATQQQSG